MKRLSSTKAKLFASTPYIEGISGDSYYLITDITDGIDLKKENFIRNDSSIDMILSYFCCVAEAFEVLHKAGFLMLDIKPENLIWENSKSCVLIVDTDSLFYQEDKLDRNVFLYSNSKYAAPEIQSLQFFLDEDDFETASLIITPFGERNLYDLDSAYLLDEFSRLYSSDHIPNTNKICSMIINILSKVLIEDLLERSLVCYENVESSFYDEIMDELSASFNEFLNEINAIYESFDWKKTNDNTKLTDNSPTHVERFYRYDFSKTNVIATCFVEILTQNKYKEKYHEHTPK